MLPDVVERDEMARVNPAAVNSTHGVDGRGRCWAPLFWKAVLAFFVSLGSAAAHGDRVGGGSPEKAPTLRGFNLGARGSIPFAEQHYADLAAYGANVVRMSVHAPINDSGTAFDIAASEWRLMEQTVAMGRKHGFKVILALVPLPLGEAALHWDRPELQDSLVELWTRVAARFKGNPVIAAYDLLNEPVTPRDSNQPAPLADMPKNIRGLATSPHPGSDPWRDLAVKMIQAIRRADADSVVIFEPSPWALPKGFAHLTPLPFARVVYSFHFYEPHALTHQGLYENRDELNYPSGQISRASLSKAVEPVRAFSRKYAVPIFVGEFSIVRWAPGDSAARYVSDVIDIFEAEGWGWAYHSFREYEGWDPELEPTLPRGAKAIRSAKATTIRLLVERGFSKNLPAAVGR